MPPLQGSQGPRKECAHTNNGKFYRPLFATRDQTLVNGSRSASRIMRIVPESCFGSRRHQLGTEDRLIRIGDSRLTREIRLARKGRITFKRGCDSDYKYYCLNTTAVMKRHRGFRKLSVCEERKRVYWDPECHQSGGRRSKTISTHRCRVRGFPRICHFHLINRVL